MAAIHQHYVLHFVTLLRLSILQARRPAFIANAFCEEAEESDLKTGFEFLVFGLWFDIPIAIGINTTVVTTAIFSRQLYVSL